MTISTHTELQTAMTNWLGRDDYTTRYPEFIIEAEARFNRELRTRQMEASTTLVLSGGSAALPSDYLEWMSARWIGTRSQDLTYHSPDSEAWRYRFRPNQDPTMFTIMAGSLFTRPAGSTENVTFVYYQTIPDLATNSTNWLLTRAPDIYLHAALYHAMIFEKNDERAQVLWALVTKDIESLNAEADSNKLGRVGTYDSSIQDKAASRSTQTGPV